MPQTPTVIIIEPDAGRRRILSLLVRAASTVMLSECSNVAEARQIMAEQSPDIILCSWSGGGQDLLADRIANHRDTPVAGSPRLILLANEITPGMIGAARKDRRTDLIPSNPLNLNALRNRVLLCLEGPSALAVRLSRRNATLRQALETLPGLRRRLAA